MFFIVSDMDSTGVLIAQMNQKIQKAARIVIDALNITELARRQSQGGTTSFMPIGAIIGIAVAGSVILFGIIATIIIHCVRSRHKRSKKSKRTRDLDLSDDNEDDVFEALQSTRPPEPDLTRSQPLKLSHHRKKSIPKKWDEGNKYFGPPLPNSQVMPSTYALQITGLRDSWPLVGWIPPPTPALTVEKRSVTNKTHPGQRSSHSALMLSTENEPTWPQRTLSKSTSSGRIDEDKSTCRSNHSANPSITSMNILSSSRRSVSDKQLTSILRSTSQRLRDAQRRPISRSMSVMSQESGAPPVSKPPSPPADQRGGSQEALIDLDDALDADSVRSSVLNATSHTPSPSKRSAKSAYPVTEREIHTATISFDEFNTNNLSLSEKSELFALAPRSKHGALFNQGSESRTSCSFMDESSARPDRGNGMPLETSRRDGLATENHDPNESTFANDPFIYSEEPFESRPLSVKIPNSHLRMSHDIEQGSTPRASDGSSFPLRDISGNQTSLNKPRGVGADTLVGKNPKPFQWSSDVQSLVNSLGQRPTGTKQKGHKRRRTVRFSHVPRPVSVGVVLEEPENDNASLQMLKVANKSESEDDTDEGSLSCNRPGNEIPDLGPPDAPVFQPSFLTLPPPEVLSESKRSSIASYSATLSFYDYYSSTNPYSLSQTSSSHTCPSPTPSMKKARRQGRNFSIDANKANNLGLASFPPLKPFENLEPVEYDGTLASLIREDPSPKNTSVSGAEKSLSSRPAGSTRLFGPRALPQPSPVDSVTSSISLLRRMNSEVSTYSTSSFLSDQSRGSPTITKFRACGTSPASRGHSGTMNYLSIGNKTPSSRSRREQRREFAMSSEVGSHVAVTSKNQTGDQEPINLEMPALKYLPGLPSPDFNTDPGGQDKQTHQPQRPKAPLAQLRPAGTSNLTLANCQSCNEPLLPSSSIALPQHHDRCLLCITCKSPVNPHDSHTVDRLRYCSEHCPEQITALSGNDVDRASTDNNENLADKDARWSKIMTTPQKTSVRHESKLEMPAPKGLSPKSVIEWRGSLGLYDDLGFLRSSPDRVRVMDLSPSPKRLALGDLGLKL